MFPPTVTLISVGVPRGISPDGLERFDQVNESEVSPGVIPLRERIERGTGGDMGEVLSQKKIPFNNSPVSEISTDSLKVELGKVCNLSMTATSGSSILNMSSMPGASSPKNARNIARSALSPGAEMKSEDVLVLSTDDPVPVAPASIAHARVRTIVNAHKNFIENTPDMNKCPPQEY
jgi:hypothetical protein